jgi:hypothetical protein
MIISKKKAYTVLLYLSVLVLLINSYEITFIIWSFTALVTLRKSYSVKVLELIAILFLVIVIAFFSSFFSSHKTYNFVRDIAYLLKPIIGILIGYNICKSIGPKMLRLVIHTGVVLAIVHIFTLIICFLFFSISNIHELRHYGGYFDDYEVCVLMILLFSAKFSLNLTNKKVIVFSLIILTSLLLYLARTNIIQFIIMFLALKGYFRITPRSLKVMITTVVITLACYSAIYYSYPNRKGKGIEAFFYKIKIAPIEAFKTKINQDDWKEFNDNYRSFENIITVRQVTGNGWFTTFFGKGLGSTVDIGREMWTNDGELIRYVPALHNAYMTMFLKSGLAGVFLTILFIIILTRNLKSETEEIRYINYLIIGTGIFLILSNWVFMGLYLKLDNKSIFLGFLLCYRELLLKEHRLSIKNNVK